MVLELLASTGMTSNPFRSQRRPNLKQAFLCLVIFCIVGCERTSSSHPAVAPALPTGAESERGVLEKALDAWTFGDSDKQFKAKHPDIDFFELLDPYRPSRLLRYEIGAARPLDDPDVDGGSEFAVTLVFAGANGQEQKTNKTYRVRRTKANRWLILNTSG